MLPIKSTRLLDALFLEWCYTKKCKQKNRQNTNFDDLFERHVTLNTPFTSDDDKEKLSFDTIFKTLSEENAPQSSLTWL